MVLGTLPAERFLLSRTTPAVTGNHALLRRPMPLLAGFGHGACDVLRIRGGIPVTLTSELRTARVTVTVNPIEHSA